jgi:putative transcription factor
MPCEMCGNETNLTKAEIEGVELSVCSNCAKHGKVKRTAPRRDFKKIQREEVVFNVVDNFATLIKQCRDSRGMSQEEFSKIINEKQSLLAKWEHGDLKPRVDIARKLGKLLEKNFIAREQSTPTTFENKKVSEEFTLGDMIKVRKRRK